MQKLLSFTLDFGQNDEIDVVCRAELIDRVIFVSQRCHKWLNVLA